MGNLLVNLLQNLWQSLLENTQQATVTSFYRYQIDRPWRQPSVWDEKLQKRLMKDIINQQSDSCQNILILGPTGAGKSRFIDSAIDIFQRQKYPFSIDTTDDMPILPTSRRFRSAEHQHRKTAFCLSHETKIGEGINIVDSKLFVKSIITKRYLSSPFGSRPYHSFGTECQIHCVTLIVSAMDIIDDESKCIQIKQLHQKLKQNHIPVVLVLTMVDVLCEEVRQDITKMFRSKKVLEVIKTASEMFEIGEGSIHPVVNYVNDSEMRTEINIPLLLALKHSLYLASKYLQNDGEQVLPYKGRRYLPKQMPTEKKLTTELIPSEYLSAIDRGKRYLSTQMPMGKTLTTESISLEYSPAIYREKPTDMIDLSTQMPKEKKQTTLSISSEYFAAIDKVEKLLNENNLPKNDDLQSIYKRHGRQYEPLKLICEKICNIIKKKLYNDAVQNIWPARKLVNENVVFVVELAREAAVHPTFQHDLEIFIDHGDTTGKKESIEIMTKERDFLKNKTDEYRNKLLKLQPILLKHSKQLMDQHKNITAILPCVIKSVGHGTPDKHLMFETLCISIHVKRKISGLIPLDEEQISTMVEDIPTDVVQGECRLFFNGPNDYHGNLKMGLAIHARASNDKGDILGGTLGCFVQHKRYGMCCITNAHIVLQQSELQHLFRCCHIEYGTNNGKPVFQPLSLNKDPFGIVVAAAGYGGNAFKPGLEVALIKILNRQPLSGSFPQSTSETAPTFTFNTGSITDVDLLQLGVEVFKFGMETGPTIGFLHSHGAFANYNEGIQLHQQIVVMPANDEIFAAPGDSGSSVFVGFSRPGRESVIGLISGGLDNGLVFVTPIYDILQSVKCEQCLHRFENIDDNGTYMSSATECAGGEETMDGDNKILYERHQTMC